MSFYDGMAWHPGDYKATKELQSAGPAIRLNQFVSTIFVHCDTRSSKYFVLPGHYTMRYQIHKGTSGESAKHFAMLSMQDRVTM